MKQLPTALIRRLLLSFAAVGAFSLALALCPATASASHGPHHVIGTISGKQTGTVVRKSGSRTFTMHFSRSGKLVSATETGGPHGMMSKALTITKGTGSKPGAHGYGSVCYYYACDYYGYCYYYYYYC